MSKPPVIFNGDYAKFLTTHLRFGRNAEVDLLYGTADPSAGAGVAANEGSIYVRATGAGASVYQKQDSVTDTSWTAILSGSASSLWAVANFTGTTITAAASAFQKARYTGGSAQTLTAITGSPGNGQIIVILGTSDTDTITVEESDVAGGILMNGPFLGTRGANLMLQFDTGLNRWTEISRSI